jgi:hypothetical protein
LTGNPMHKLHSGSCLLHCQCPPLTACPTFDPRKYTHAIARAHLRQHVLVAPGLHVECIP